ncbi:RNA polymerase sigma factor [Sporosarcina highlanderae]|uniref:RNA polymerase sigma factor n=1 Tax=Sporosarcina highlanderae TaxID=3035916 RepID=A0ABT8JMA2_9BACL|nr:RNA polymerase sigma factor [Sporosarcina highlanderae]MDN4606281.1 RNA polymerase sigma factor [Sporosarcina highlanderae]
MSPDQWIEQIRAGDQAAFRQFYNAYADAAIRTASAITRNREMAKDAVQETFIRVYRQINNYNPNLPFDPWFYRILTNECLRLLKKDSPLSKFELPDPETNPSLTEESFDYLSDLYDVIQSMDDIHRIPLILKYVKGFSEKEIADILGLNQNTVKSRLFIGRKKLREQLQPDEEEEESK